MILVTAPRSPQPGLDLDLSIYVLDALQYLKYVALVHQGTEGGVVVKISVEFTTGSLKTHSIMSSKAEF